MLARLLLWTAALAAIAGPKPPQQPDGEDLENLRLRELLSIRRVYVDRLTGGEVAAHIREMIVAALHSAKLFVLTENPERADAILRGSAEDLIYTDTFASSEGLSVRGSFGTGSARTSTSQGTRTYGSLGLGEHSSTRMAERRHEASAAVRLVNKEGDVIWATTQESTGGKFRGASADVADKITRQLLADYERARRTRRPGAPPPAQTVPPAASSIGGGPHN